MKKQSNLKKAQENNLQKKGRTKHLSQLKIASSETIAEFIKNHDAYFENHTRDRKFKDQANSEENIRSAEGSLERPVRIKVSAFRETMHLTYE